MNTKDTKDLIIKILNDKQAENIIEMDLSGKSAIAEYMIFASGRSTKNVSSIADNISLELKHHGVNNNLEGLRQSEWVLIDTGDIIVHIFHPEARAHYRLEELWGKIKLKD